MKKDTPAPTIVHLSGIPACGKSTYGKWLEQEKGFLHLDFDKLLQGEGTSGKLALIRILQTNGSRSFIETIRKTVHPAALDWGFPPNNLPLVRNLQEEGVKVWWFDGDREAARQAFIRREAARQAFIREGDVSVETLDRQMALIERHWAKIMEIVGSRVIKTLRKDGSYLSSESIFTQMFGVGT